MPPPSVALDTALSTQTSHGSSPDFVLRVNSCMSQPRFLQKHCLMLTHCHLMLPFSLMSQKVSKSITWCILSPQQFQAVTAQTTFHSIARLPTVHPPAESQSQACLCSAMLPQIQPQLTDLGCNRANPLRSARPLRFHLLQLPLPASQGLLSSTTCSRLISSCSSGSKAASSKLHMPTANVLRWSLHRKAHQALLTPSAAAAVAAGDFVRQHSLQWTCMCCKQSPACSCHVTAVTVLSCVMAQAALKGACICSKQSPACTSLGTAVTATTWTSS